MFRQLQFMLNKELGFNKEHVMVISRANVVGNHITSFKDEDNNWGYVSIRLSPEAGAATLDEIEKIWASWSPRSDFSG